MIRGFQNPFTKILGANTNKNSVNLLKSGISKADLSPQASSNSRKQQIITRSLYSNTQPQNLRESSYSVEFQGDSINLDAEQLNISASRMDLQRGEHDTLESRGSKDGKHIYTNESQMFDK